MRLRSNVVWAVIDTPPRSRGVRKRAHREAAARRALEDLAQWQASHPVIFQS